jgi:hypothetical protein
LREIRNWMRAASYGAVRDLLTDALPDAKARSAYQMCDGTASLEQVRVACKMSPNSVGSLAQRCVAMGLMEVADDKRRVRLFDLNDFGMVGEGGVKGFAKDVTKTAGRHSGAERDER